MGERSIHGELLLRPERQTGGTSEERHSLSAEILSEDPVCRGQSPGPPVRSARWLRVRGTDIPNYTSAVSWMTADKERSWCHYPPKLDGRRG